MKKKMELNLINLLILSSNTLLLILFKNSKSLKNIL